MGTSPCVQALNQPMKAASAMGSCQGIPKDDPQLVQICKAMHGRSLPTPAVNELDEKVLCAVFCCCNSAPNVGATKQDLRQSCVQTTLQKADQDMGYHSRYKAEISYDMTKNPPAPLMHRDANGNDTTQPSEYWQGRADDIPGYQSGTGMVRRPDVVMVKDPTKPPTQDNILQIIEMKFPGDKDSRGQMDDYRKIAGRKADAKILDTAKCKCPEKKPEPHTVPHVDYLKLFLAALLALLLLILLKGGMPEELPDGGMPLPSPSVA